MVHLQFAWRRLALTSLWSASLVMATALIIPALADTAEPSTPVRLSQVDETDETIVQVASGNDAFQTLVAAVQAADLVDLLSSPGPFTVFAPTDEAFAALPAGVLDALLLPENQDLLASVLAYHVVPDALMADQLETGGLDTLNGGLAVQVTPDQVVVNNASVILPDVPASNGVIHAINRVLIPIGLVEELQARQPAPAEPAAPAAAPAPAATPAPQPVRGLW
ncbi:MAG: fasciclin domain-containing protein [Kaiparowitsia implicata GSE-PSE-MK54-09C]|jgi:uncharacterized surface protein with fasciclin (FAS1) repeats|nr:fasciclin domain-containing protein [Kaiparowitsia implicata GSE-PSE-MK54-09C]